MKCSIVQDLLSNYIDGLTSPETSAEIEAHLHECADCRAVYEKMTASLPEEPAPQDKDIDFLKIMKEKIRMKNVLFFLGWLAAAVFFTAFTKTYSIVLPFDSERMSVECFRSAVLINDAGQIQWEALTPDTPGYDEKKAYDNTLRLARLAFRGYVPGLKKIKLPMIEDGVVDKNDENYDYDYRQKHGKTEEEFQKYLLQKEKDWGLEIKYWKSSDGRWHYDRPYTGHVDEDILSGFLEHEKISIEEYLINKKYVVIQDRDEYCEFSNFKKTGLVNCDVIDHEYPKRKY